MSVKFFDLVLEIDFDTEIRSPENQEIIPYDTNNKIDQERIKVYLFAKELFHMNWAKQVFFDEGILRWTPIGMKLSDYFNESIFKAVNVTQALLREYFKSMVDLCLECNLSNVPFEYFIVCSWFKNRDDVFVKLIDVLAIIAEIILHKSNFVDPMTISTMCNFFLYFYEKYLEKEFLESGGWEQLKQKSEDWYGDLYEILNRNVNFFGVFKYARMIFDCEVIDRLRNSVVKFPVPKEFVCENCEEPTDETKKIIFATFDDNTTDDIKMHHTKTGDKEDLFLSKDKILCQNSDYFKTLMEENSERIKACYLRDKIHISGEVLFFSDKLFQNLEFATEYFSEKKMSLDEQLKSNPHEYVFLGGDLKISETPQFPESNQVVEFPIPEKAIKRTLENENNSDEVTKISEPFSEDIVERKRKKSKTADKEVFNIVNISSQDTNDEPSDKTENEENKTLKRTAMKRPLEIEDKIDYEIPEMKISKISEGVPQGQNEQKNENEESLKRTVMKRTLECKDKEDYEIPEMKITKISERIHVIQDEDTKQISAENKDSLETGSTSQATRSASSPTVRNSKTARKMLTSILYTARPATQVAGPATQVAGPATQVAGPATQVAGPATQVAGPATQVAGPATQVAGPATSQTARHLKDKSFTRSDTTGSASQATGSASQATGSASQATGSASQATGSASQATGSASAQTSGLSVKAKKSFTRSDTPGSASQATGSASAETEKRTAKKSFTSSHRP